MSTDSSIKKIWRRPEFLTVWITGGMSVVVAALSVWFMPGLAAVIVCAILGGVTVSAFFSIRKIIAVAASAGHARRELMTLIEGLRDGVIVYDPNFTIINLNAAAVKLTGVSSDEVVGKQIEPGSVKNPHLRPLAQILFPSLAPSMVQLSEPNEWPQIVALTLDQPPLELSVTLFRILGGRGELVGFLKLVHDRTRERSIIREKSEFISTAAHQLRTPLTAIEWAIQNLIKRLSPLPDEDRELVRQIARLTARSLRITNDLLDASKIEEGRFGYAFETADIVAFVKRVVEEVSVLAKEYGIEVRLESPQQSSYSLLFDPSRIATVLSNLLDNAIRYNAANGKVAISITEVPGAPFLKITVTDTGIGIPPDETQKMFGKLERGSNAIQIEPNGTGLGLYIAKNIVRRHGGDIGFESTVGRGTSFWFTLPLDPTLIPPKEVAVGDRV